MTQSISNKFTTASLLRFALPSIIMMMFMSCYVIVDGIFISRYIGSNALSSLNIVYPMVNIILAVGVMLATGGSAVVGKKLGEGKDTDARKDFSLLVTTGVIGSIVILSLTIVFLEPICRLLGSSELLLADCKTYLFCLMIFAPASMLQSLYQSFFVTAGKPKLGLAFVVGAGITNIILDYVFIGILDFGIEGAALATGIGQLIPAVIGTIVFFLSKEGLYFVPFRIHFKTLKQSCLNGSSEMVSNISTALITYLFNLVMMRMIGENGVSAITIILYGEFLFNALYLGFSIGVAPIFSFNYGAKNKVVLRHLYKICISFVLISSVILTLLSFLGKELIVGIFVGEQNATYDLTLNGFAIFSLCYLFSGFNIFSSALFTSLSDGKTSAIISFTRTFVFIALSLLILPELIGINGVWLAIPIAEALTIILSIVFHRTKLKQLFLF